MRAINKKQNILKESPEHDGDILQRFNEQRGVVFEFPQK